MEYMCLAIPMRVIELEGFNATCEARNVERSVNLFLLEPGSVHIGDYVMVHVGSAIQIISQDDAEIAWSLYDEILQHDA